MSFLQANSLSPLPPAMRPDLIFEPSPDFRDKFNRLPFMYSHYLADHSLMQLPRLVELANTLIQYGPGSIRCQASKMPKHLKWTDATLKEDLQEKLPEFIANIEHSESWLLLYSVQRDPEYCALVNQIIDELEQLTGQPLRQEMSWIDAYIFIASPRAVTSYHIDHESTFLMQMHGDRTSNLFDGHDRSILTEEELENFYIGDLTAATYSDAKQAKAYVYPMTAGKGVHHPVCAPHWYQNGEQYSIALGIHFDFKSDDRRARVHQVNYYLRKLGLNPTPPGQSAFKDSLKIKLIGLFSDRCPQTKSDVLYSGIRRLRGMTAKITHTLKIFAKKLD
ncbi:hypothetical protein ACN4EG_07240 [Alkalinema pantanalense CENA528]|uniref:hypothetical protein n=1 Tax=Alkalinema pantanalense TaxID=1620705 RepID=UPI003D6F6E39